MGGKEQPCLALPPVLLNAVSDPSFLGSAVTSPFPIVTLNSIRHAQFGMRLQWALGLSQGTTVTSALL